MENEIWPIGFLFGGLKEVLEPGLEHGGGFSVDDDLGLFEIALDGDVVYCGVEVAEFVDEFEVKGFFASEDLALGEGENLLFGEFTVFFDFTFEGVVHLGLVALDHIDFFFSEWAVFGSHIHEFAGFDDFFLDAEHFIEGLLVLILADNADAASKGPAIGVDAVASEGDVVSAGCSHVTHYGVEWFFVEFGFKFFESVVNAVRGDTATARAVDTDDHALN